MMKLGVKRMPCHVRQTHRLIGHRSAVWNRGRRIRRDVSDEKADIHVSISHSEGFLRVGEKRNRDEINCGEGAAGALCDDEIPTEII